MRILKTLMLLLVSIASYFSATACGGWEEYDTYFRLFMPKYMIAGEEFASITYVDEPWSNISVWYPDENEQEENIKLWKDYFPVSFADKEIKQFIYKLSFDDLKSYKQYPNRASNQVIKWVLANDIKILDYLIFAKDCQQFCNPQVVYYWEEPEEKDLSVYEGLIDKAKLMFANCKNTFLKERLAFQLIKLMRHAEKYDECLAFWNKYLAKNKKTTMYYWTLDHIAGVQLKKGLSIEAWKNFMEVFIHCPGKRFSSYCSIKIGKEGDWLNLLHACDNDKEKETMYFMRASQLGSVALDDIDSLYRINPKSEYLPILICREINKIESIFLQNDEKENVFYQLYFNNKNINQDLNDYLRKFNNFLLQCIDEKEVNEIDFWRLSHLYTSFLLQDFDTARELMSFLPKNMTENFKNQLTIIQNLLLITDRSKSSIQRQNELQSIWSDDVYGFAFLFMRHPSNKLPYPLNLNENLSGLRANLDTGKLKALLHLANNPEDLSWYVSHILKTHFSSDSDYLMEMLGTSYLADDEIDLAVEIFSELSETYKAKSNTFYLSANPFNYLINDKDVDSLKKQQYSKLKLAKTLQAITMAINEGSASTMDYYLLANAQYNTSYFGYVWNSKAYFRSSAYYSANFDCTPAYNNYLRAASELTDKEMKAKCYYLAAKAHQNMFLVEQRENMYSKYEIQEDEMEKKGYREEFLKLKDNYNDTEFYDRIIEECKYFRFYVN